MSGTNRMQIKLADISEIGGVLELHYRYHIDSINEKDRANGFVTTPFTKEQMKELIERENGLVIAKAGDQIVAYVIAASWQFWSAWPMYQYMIKELPKLSFLGQKLTSDNSYQYGPVCVDKTFRGVGVLEQVFELSRKEMAALYPIMVTFINKKNPRSYEAHVRKLGLQVIHEFEYNGNHYYELAYDTRKQASPGIS